MTINPVELERLAQVARIKHSNELANTPFGVMPSREFEQIASVLTDIADKLRTGQLVPAMPSGDEVEAVARAIRRSEIGNFSDETRAHSVVDGSWEHRIQEAVAAITAYEAVSGVAKMREALREIGELTERRQLPLTNQINDIVLKALRAKEAGDA